jgi:hypothetical protein
MIGQLVAIHVHGLLEPDELEPFTERTRTTVELLAKEFGRYAFARFRSSFTSNQSASSRCERPAAYALCVEC